MEEVNPRVFFDIEVGGIPMGRIVFELFAGIQPKTCQNFLALTTGEMGIGATTGKPLHYKNSIFHRVVKNFMIQGGDFSIGNGTGGESIYGGAFPDESFELMHDKPFLLSMANRGKDTNGSQFFITTQVAPHLDNIHVVFGQVLSGSEIVSHIEGLQVDHISRPLTEAKIVNCGELVLISKSKKNSRDSGTSFSHFLDEKYQKRNKRKKNKIRSISSENESEKKSEDENSGHQHPLVSVTKIDPHEIPDIPSNRFLFRAGLKNNSNQTEYNQIFERNRARNYRNNGAGRIFKGRGIFRYHTPSRSRSRSPTPPHWKQAQNRTVKLQDIKKNRDNKAHANYDHIRRFVENSEKDSRRFSKFNKKNDDNLNRDQYNIEKTSEKNHHNEPGLQRQYRRSGETNWRQEAYHEQGQRHKKSCKDRLSEQPPDGRRRERTSRKSEKCSPCSSRKHYSSHNKRKNCEKKSSKSSEHPSDQLKNDDQNVNNQFSVNESNKQNTGVTKQSRSSSSFRSLN